MPGTKPFRLPKDGHMYITKIITRCEDLIYHGIWYGIEPKRLSLWLANFKTDEEQYFAACVLDSIIYRSDKQTLALLKQLFQLILPELHRAYPMPLPEPINDWMEETNKNKPYSWGPSFRFVTVVKKSDPPTKSAYLIARYMKRDLNVMETLIISPWEIEDSIKKGIKVFLFIDDFLGTGNQFCDFVTEENIERFLKDIYAAYIPLVAHRDGIEAITTKYNKLVKVNAVEILDNTHRLFHKECTCFDDGENTPDSAKQYYYDLLIRKGINITGDDRRGYGGLELTYVFQHAVPDNCLPILWWDEPNVWNPLFNR